MDCIKCKAKTCRTAVACKAGKFDENQVLTEYTRTENQEIVQAAAKLVDNGRAGTLSRLQEIVEFANEMNYGKIGLAYCYGMENEAMLITNILRNKNLKVVPVSCTAGGLSQKEVNAKSQIENVSCNPISQALQLNHEKVDLTLSMGLCLGHDILFNRYIQSDVTTLVVKDRVHNHSPLKELKTK
ncbi:MAG: DUF1847 domain-containing protein [Bacteroidales bacterium]|nr:DUF1847 domain-containing protein [Bacteroidales bacterium]MBN2820183.1 DUF1847 domain-containing protein [Bacteroidales bacterium]